MLRNGVHPSIAIIIMVLGFLALMAYVAYIRQFPPTSSSPPHTISCSTTPDLPGFIDCVIKGSERDITIRFPTDLLESDSIKVLPEETRYNI